MTKKIGKFKKLNKAVSRERKAIEAENSDVPQTMIFCKPNSSNIVKQLVNDFKCTMKPHTLKEIFCSRSNTLKDYIDYATKSHVKSIIYFTHAKLTNKTCDWNESTNYQRGGVYCNVVIMPHGPSFTYRVKEYSLKRDIQTLTGFGMNNNYMLKPPLLICEGFGNSENTEYLKAVSSSFQNMLPTLNINKMQFSSVRRVLLISHQNIMPEVDELTQKKLGEVFVFRHYLIKLENKELNRNIRKLGVGVTSKNVKVPDLSKYGSIAEFISRTGHASESEMSDVDGEGATIELTESVKELPGSTGKTAVRLMEVGPRMTLQLIKIQEGIHSGALLYHRFVKRTKEEIFEMEKKRAEKLKLKEKRREQQLKNVEKKQKLKEEHKKICLKGMEAKGYVKETKSDSEEDEETKVHIVTNDEEDEQLDEEIDDIENSEEDDDDDDDLDGIEDVNDSLDESSDSDDKSGIEEDSDDKSEIEEDSDDKSGIEEDSDGIEGLDDDNDIDLSDCELESSDFQVKGNIKQVEKYIQSSINLKKRPHSSSYKNSKKRKL